jgi:hypothetical protein
VFQGDCEESLQNVFEKIIFFGNNIYPSPRPALIVLLKDSEVVQNYSHTENGRGEDFFKEHRYVNCCPP